MSKQSQDDKMLVELDRLTLKITKSKVDKLMLLNAPLDLVTMIDSAIDTASRGNETFNLSHHFTLISALVAAESWLLVYEEKQKQKKDTQ